MTPISSRALAPAAQRPMASAVSLLLLVTVLSAVLFIALRSPLKDDIAWLLYVARRWLAGRELYIDVFEVNPPLIVWISAIPLEIARWSDVGSKFVVMPFFVTAVLGCAWWTATLLRAQGGLFAQRLPVFAAIGCALLILPAADLGQREHLLVAAFLPYLVLFARCLDLRCLDSRKSPDGAAAAVIASLAAGVLAGLGCALKPRYGAVFAVLECLALTRGVRPWRIMPVAAGATLVGYAGLVAIACPAYLRRAVPMALALYGATDVPFPELLADSALLLCGLAVTIGLLWLGRRSHTDYNQVLSLIVFAATSTLIWLVDGKDWY